LSGPPRSFSLGGSAGALGILSIDNFGMPVLGLLLLLLLLFRLEGFRPLLPERPKLFLFVPLALSRGSLELAIAGSLSSFRGVVRSDPLSPLSRLWRLMVTKLFRLKLLCVILLHDTSLAMRAVHYSRTKMHKSRCMHRMLRKFANIGIGYIIFVLRVEKRGHTFYVITRGRSGTMNNWFQIYSDES
jgi:hypothetical protein